MKIISVLAFATAVLCKGKNIRIVGFRSGHGLTGASSSCKVKISNHGTGETLDLHCSTYGFGDAYCNSESKDSSYGNYDARIMDCTNNGLYFYAKVAVWDRVGQYMAIKEFRDKQNPSCGHTPENRSCQTTWLVDEFWGDA
ncbi:hypothetical protein CONCODRAFT_169702 [Conidiobolus coronatus NRRL 28638]|uniref:Uncharacterized protein n=1 Tax=Conidiobolus coronatus (strain ATCC 28846 / CBS 209.66 / NRRL 28638) TaxID=796925 RepID=A0A137NR38_CONC2|nr:hypothetical protein CONCODRAFT_169702 [Conidiobolus coronatus NRRL 28638]|eukprot:KXN65233.1 hypothetical protein CONCODRAFT_169702 [Conidiobolus coronatus NRRL 28638]